MDFDTGIVMDIDSYIEDEDNNINTLAEAVLAYLSDNNIYEENEHALMQLIMAFLGDGDFYFDTYNSDLTTRRFVSVNPINEDGVFAEVMIFTDGVSFRLVSDTYSVDGSIRREVYESIFVQRKTDPYLLPPWPAIDVDPEIEGRAYLETKWFSWWDYFDWPGWWGDRPQPVY